MERSIEGIIDDILMRAFWFSYNFFFEIEMSLFIELSNPVPSHVFVGDKLSKMLIPIG